MTISALYFLDNKGKVIISRDYRSNTSLKCVDRFIARVLEEDENDLKPVFEEDGVNYVYVKHNNLYVLALTALNSDASMIVLFLYKLLEVFSEYFDEVEEESIRDNFVIIYELLDEMMDFGYPQATDASLLKEFITQKGHQLTKSQVHVPKAITGVGMNSRPDNVYYPKNEVYLDVVEKINLLASTTGTLLRSEIVGQININCRLSGIPELRLGLNDRIRFDGLSNKRPGEKRAMEIEDVKFHQCVRLSKLESDKMITFIPPDGEFELMSYRLSTPIKPLIWVEAIVDQHKHSRVDYLIKARSQFKSRSVANNVEIEVPVPADADSPKFKATIGTVKYDPSRNVIIWSIKQYQGGKDYMMRAHFGLPSIESEEQLNRPPINVKFEIPYFTVSGIQVRYLKILEKSGYQALPWVRYLTMHGDYQIRLN